MLNFSPSPLASRYRPQMALVVFYLRQIIALLLPPLCRLFAASKEEDPRWPRPWIGREREREGESLL